MQLLGISGSLRAGSNTTAVLHALVPLLSGRADLRVLTLEEVPPYNADLDGVNLPRGVAQLKEAIAAADGLIVCSPEYNYGIPGVLKNAIDWASRPSFKSPLKDKPALIVTSSPGLFGGVRAQAQIRDAFSAVLARPIARPHVAIPGVDKKIVEGRIADEATAKFLVDAVDQLLQEIQRGATAG